MNVLQRALNRIRQAIIPTVHAPSPGPAPFPAPIPRIQTERAHGGAQWQQGQPGLMERMGQQIIAPIQQLGRDWQRGADTPGGVLGEGGLLGPARRVEGEELTPAAVVLRQTPPPSQPATITPEVRTPAPTLTPGDFQRQAPAPVGPITRAPIMTPAAAPMTAGLPPTPFLPGGGWGEDIIGGRMNIPVEAPLPPDRVMPADIGGQAPMGQFDAMIRALQQMQQGGQGRFVPMPAVGVAPFGPAGMQERALRRLRERELGRMGL